jgi:hypothetical protein
VKGGNLIQLDYQTAVHERRAYMLYSRMRNKLMKRESTEGGRQKNGRWGVTLIRLLARPGHTVEEF